MDNLFFSIIVLTSVPSLLFLLWLILKPITERYISSRWQYGILRVILILYIIPFYKMVNNISEVFNISISMPSVFAFQNFNEMAKTDTTNVMTFTQTISQDANGYSLNIGSILSVVWIIFIFVGIIRYCLDYYKFMKINKSLKEEINISYLNELQKQVKTLGIKSNIGIYKSEFVNSPMLIGLFSPKILLPQKELELNHISYIISHELTHLKRRDLWWKVLLGFVSILHFFNPLIYLFQIEFETELEYSCDEKVTNQLKFEERKNYGLAILSAVQITTKTNPFYVSVGFVNTKQNLERRIKNMLNIKKMKLSTKIFTGALVVCTLTAVAVPAFASQATTGYGEIEKENYEIMEIPKNTELMFSDENGNYVSLQNEPTREKWDTLLKNLNIE